MPRYEPDEYPFSVTIRAGLDPDVTREEDHDQDTVAINRGLGVPVGVGTGVDVTLGLGLGVDAIVGEGVGVGVGNDNVMEFVPLDVMYESDKMAFPFASCIIHPPISNNMGASVTTNRR
jgi:hypothetical protein